MRSQGVSENDPEFIKVRNFLADIHKVTQMRNMMKNKNAAAAAAAAAKPEQNGSAVAVNGTKAAPLDASLANGSSAPADAAANESPISASKPGLHSFSQEQLTLLRMQISAFKSLSKNLPLNAAMQGQLFAKPSQSEPPADGKAAAQSATPGAEVAIIEKKKLGINRWKSYIDPYSRLPYLVYSELRKARGLTPSVTPVGIDVSKLIEDRATILYNRLEARKNEIANMHANIAAWNSQSSELQTDDSAIKRKLLIEYKKLSLLQKQRNLRESVRREMMNADNLAMTANRSHYRRLKAQSVHEARIAEKVEKQQRQAREIKEKKKQTDFLTSILGHAEELHKSAQSHRSKKHKLGRLMLQQHQILEKEEQKRIERTAKQRLQALKANDEETYLKLLGQAKDTRISHLLGQTDGFLKQLAASVKAQQKSARDRYRDRSMVESESEPEDDDGGEGRVDYYEVAHRLKEEVYQQSSNLVGGTLKEYQIKGLQWMISLYNNNLNGILADEMGLGKTIQTISLITYLIEKKREQGPFLVIVPLSTLTNWNSEFEKWAPSVKRIVYKGPPNARKQQQQAIRWGQFQVLLTTYEFVIKDRPILSKIKWLHMIVDEGHRMKNAKSKLSSTITEYYNTRYRLILTGTPLQNNLPELWALLNFVLPNIFKSVKSFDEWFNTPFANTGGQDKMELNEEEQLLIIRRLHKVLRPFLLRRLKKDVEKDLPDKTERVIKCSFSSLQARLYKQLVTNQKLIVSDGKGGRTGVRGLSNMLMQLRKLCNHPFVFEQVEDQVNPERLTNDWIWRSAGKFELLDRVLPKMEKTGHRILMFFQMTQIMNIMEDFLRYRGVQYLRLDGSTKADERSDLLKAFNAPDSPYFCFLLSTRAGGLGLNLQTADTVIIYDSDWNPHQDLQAQDRAHRIGQKNEVRILRLITSNSVEEKILERANFKLDMDGKVIQAGKFDNKSTNEERDAMLRVIFETAEAPEVVEEEEMDDEDLNLMLMRSDEELILFQKMDEERNADKMYGPHGKLPRLMGDNELPDIYLQDDVPEEPEVEEPRGRGARERTRIRYDDGLTEEQWLEAVDNTDEDLDEVIAKNDQKKHKRSVNKEKKKNPELDTPGRSSPQASSAHDSRENSESPVPAPKKRGRKPKPEKRKLDDMEDANGTANGDSAAPTTPVGPPRKRGRQSMGKASDPLAGEDRAKLQKVLNAAYDELIDLEEEGEDDDTPARDIIGIFLDLPDRHLYPDYYEIIHDPICMNQIKRKINRKEYQSLGAFVRDIRLLCNNCRTYNEDTSILFKDANLIENTMLDTVRKELDAVDMTDEWSGELEEGPKSAPPVRSLAGLAAENGDGNMSGVASSAGTPLAMNGMSTLL
jgi:ATP-dependent helicase STH1/SNF2